MEAIRNAKLWLVRKGFGVNYFSFSMDPKVRAAALRAQILEGKITPQELAQTIFNRTLNFKEAYTLALYDPTPEGGVRQSIGTVVPQQIEIDKIAIREYKELISSLPLAIRAKWDPAIAQKLIELGQAEYNIVVSTSITKAPLTELSFQVSKLLNQIGVQ